MRWYESRLQCLTPVFLLSLFQPGQHRYLLVHPTLWISLRQGAHVPGKVLVCNNHQHTRARGELRQEITGGVIYSERRWDWPDITHEVVLPCHFVRWSVCFCFCVFICYLKMEMSESCKVWKARCYWLKLNSVAASASVSNTVVMYCHVGLEPLDLSQSKCYLTHSTFMNSLFCVWHSDKYHFI